MSSLPIPLSRIELYLAAAAGMTGVILPEKPESREELYLARIAGEEVTLPIPASLKELWLAYVCGETPNPLPELEGAELIGNQKVDVRYFAVAAGMDGVTAPAPQNRTEEYWARIAEIKPIHGVLKYATGTSIILTDVVSGLNSLENIYGNTTQQTYTGKNLLPIEDGTLVESGLTFTIQNGVLTINGTSTGVAIVKLTNGLESYSGATPNPTWLSETMPATSLDGKTISAYYQSGTSAAASCAFRLFSNTTSFVRQWYPATYDLEYYFGTSSNVPSCLTFFFNNGLTFTNYKVALQLEKGSTATSYEPYVGGIPSPNPDYPQTVNVVTGTQNVWVHGKNLFDYASASDVDNTTVATYRIFEISGLEPSTQYNINNIKFDSSVDITNKAVGLWSVPSYPGSPASWIVLSNQYHNNVVFNSNSEGKIYLAIYPSYKATWADLIQYFEEAQIEKGSTPTTYEPYQGATYTVDLGATELCKIGTYQDYIYKSGSDWYVHKETAVATLDGAETWTGNGSVFQTVAASTPDKGSVSAVSYSDHFTWAYYPSAITLNIKNGEFGWNSAFLLTVRNDNITGHANFETWLSTNNIKVYYNLATGSYTDTQITDNTLIGQLDALNAAVLPKPNANIEVTGNLAGEIEISYYGESE